MKRQRCTRQSSKSQKKTEYHEYDDRDRLSILPEPILHHILSYLPAEEATKTSVLSRTFNSAWKSSPILDFNQFLFQESMKKQKQRCTPLDFCYYVDKIIRNRDKVFSSVSRFQVVVCFGNRAVRCRKKLNNWLNYAIDNNVEDLMLENHKSKRNTEYMWHEQVLPESIFRAKSLESLDLFGCEFNHMSNGIGLVSLKKLMLSHVYIDEETLQSMVSTSCHLEELNIDNCRGFKFIDVSGINLKSIELYFEKGHVQTAVITAPNLKFLSYGGGLANFQISLAASQNFENLKELRLRDMDIKDEFFNTIPPLLCLEKMELTRCPLEKIRFINARALKRLILYECYSIKEIQINVGCSISFRYKVDMCSFPGNLSNATDLKLSNTTDLKFKVYGRNWTESVVSVSWI